MEQTRRYWWAFILIFLGSQLAGGFFSIVLSFFGKHWISTEWIMVATLLVANLLNIFLFFLYRPQSITWASTLEGFKGKMGRRTGWVFLLALPMILTTNIVQEVYFDNIPDWVGEDTFEVFINNPVGLMTVTLLGPLSEELLFRGGVLTDLSRTESRLAARPWMPVVVSALIFSLVHLNPVQMPAAFILGLLIGFAYIWTGSLAAPVCIHVFNNTFACVMSMLFPNDDSIVRILGGDISAGITAWICLFFIFLLITRMKKA